jgi:hypothetical protein
MPRARCNAAAAACLPAAGDGLGGCSWGCYSSSAQLEQLLDWLSKKGQREAPLRAALGPLRDRVSRPGGRGCCTTQCCSSALAAAAVCCGCVCACASPPGARRAAALAPHLEASA